MSEVLRAFNEFVYWVLTAAGIAVAVVAGLVALYMISRLVSAAWFQSKIDYEKRQNRDGQK